MSMRALLLAFFSLLVAGRASAFDVFINGVKVTGGIRDAAFDKVDVRFDAAGNVLIDAPGYQIQVTETTTGTPTNPGAPGVTPPPGVPVARSPVVGGPPVSTDRTAVVGREDYPPVPASPQVARPVNPVGDQFWLVVNNKMPGHYKMLVQVNGAQVADVPAVSPQFISNITQSLRPGMNQVQITYLPMPTAPAAPIADAVEVMIGRGATGADGTLTIGRVLGTHKKQSGNPSADAATLNFEIK